MATQARLLFGGLGGVVDCRRCAKVKLINLSFFSGIAFVLFLFTLHCLCLPCSHAPTMRHRRDKTHPAMLPTAPRLNAPGECWMLIKGQSQGSSRLIEVLVQCLPTAPPDLYRQLSLLIMHTSCRTVKPCFVRGCSPCQHVFSSKKEPCFHGQEDGEATRAKGQNDITGVSKCATAKVLSWIQKLQRVQQLLFYILPNSFSESTARRVCFVVFLYKKIWSITMRKFSTCANTIQQLWKYLLMMFCVCIHNRVDLNVQIT